MVSSRQKVVTVLLSLVALVIILTLGVGLLFPNFVRLSWQETSRRKFLLYQGETIELYGGRKIEQMFAANYPGLSQIDILFKGVDGGQNVLFHLKTSCSAGDDIVYLPTKLESIQGFTFHSFTFEPLDDSAGQSYCLVLEAPQAGPNNPVTLPLSTGDLYPRGDLIFYIPQSTNGDTPPPKVENKEWPYKVFLPIILNQLQGQITRAEDIGFLLHYRGGLLPTLRVFVARLTANKPYIWGQPWFYGGLVIAYLILLVGLFYLAWKTVQATK